MVLVTGQIVSHLTARNRLKLRLKHGTCYRSNCITLDREESIETSFKVWYLFQVKLCHSRLRLRFKHGTCFRSKCVTLDREESIEKLFKDAQEGAKETVQAWKEEIKNMPVVQSKFFPHIDVHRLLYGKKRKL